MATTDSGFSHAKTSDFLSRSQGALTANSGHYQLNTILRPRDAWHIVYEHQVWRNNHVVSVIALIRLATNRNLWYLQHRSQSINGRQQLRSQNRFLWSSTLSLIVSFWFYHISRSESFLTSKTAVISTHAVAQRGTRFTFLFSELDHMEYISKMIENE